MEYGSGSVSQRKDGTWTGRLYIGRDENGKKKIKAVYGKTEREAKRKLKEARNEFIKNDFKEIKKVTFEEYATNWLHNVKKRGIKPKSYERIECTFNNQIFPALGMLQIATITTEDIQKMLNDLADEGKAYNTYKKAYDYTKAVLTYAHDKGDIARNPSKNAVLPKTNYVPQSEVKFFTGEQVERIKAAALQQYKNGKYVYRLGWAYVLILKTGLREGEALGLQWDCIDFDKKTLTVKGNVVKVKNEDKDGATNYKYIYQNAPKTNKSYRIIPLNNDALKALEYLKELNGDKAFVLSTAQAESNELKVPQNFYRTFSAILQRAGINDIGGIHTLRHTFASLLFKAGVDVKQVSELLGHSSVQVTYDKYIHLIEEQKTRAIAQLDDI